MAIIQALATLGPIGGAIAAIGIGATTGFQIAKIKAATFADGGYTGEGIMAPDSTGHRPAGIVHDGEFCLHQRKDKRYRPFLRHYTGRSMPMEVLFLHQLNQLTQTALWLQGLIIQI